MLIIILNFNLFKWRCLQRIGWRYLITITRPALLQILKERYGIKSTLCHRYRGSTWSGLFK